MIKQKGQTLLEVLLAFSVSITVLSAIILGVVTSLGNAQYAKNQGLATSYATEGMTVIRKIRDSSWYNLAGLKDYATNVEYCIDNSLALNSISLGQNCVTRGYAVPAGGIFSREVIFEHNSSSCCSDSSCAVKGSKVTVKVSWTDNKCAIGAPYCHNVQLISCFSNTDSKLAP